MYSEEELFKTIIVTPSITVSDAIRSASGKFKNGKPELFTMRMVAGGKGERTSSDTIHLFSVSPLRTY